MEKKTFSVWPHWEGELRDPVILLSPYLGSQDEGKVKTTDRHD